MLYSIMTIEYYNLYGFKPKGYPVRHRRKVPFLPRISVPEGFAPRSRRIKEMDLDLDGFILTDKDYMELVIDAYASNVHWSTKLEGNPLKEEEVRRITKATFGGAVEEKPAGPKQEIINHLIHLINPGRFALPWDRASILLLHRYLLRGTGTRIRLGEYRKKEVAIRTDTGQETFIPAPPGSIAEEVDSLLEWVNEKAPAYDPVVASTVMFHEFESVHPFEDGNGRVGRSLFHLYLQNTGLPNSHLCKIESQLLADEELYYQLLAFTDESASYRELIDLVSGAILKSYEITHLALSKKDLLSSSLDETSKTLLRMAKRRSDWFSIDEASRWVESVGAQTIRNKLNDLSSMGAMEKKGRTRACRFRIQDPMSHIRELLEAPKRKRRGPAKARDG